MQRILFFLFVFLFLAATAKAQTWQWARVGQVPSGYGVASENWATATDKWGNGYMAGTHVATQLTFDNIVIPNLNTIKVIYLVKYDSLGNVIWARSGNPLSSNLDIGSIAVDTLGNVYLSGSTQSTTTFGNLTIPGSTNNNYFIIKYDPNGNELWERHAGHVQPINSIAIDHSGNVILAGAFTFTLTIGQYSFWSNGGDDIFIVKYSPSGNLLWAERFGSSTASDRVYDVECDAADNIYITGQFGQGYPSAGILQLGSFILTAPVNQVRDLTAKLNASGNVLWAKQSEYSGGNDLLTTSMALDQFGDVYITNRLVDSIRFAPLTLYNYPFVSYQGLMNFYVLKYSTNGDVLWLKRGGGSEGSQRSCDITVDAAGKLWICGTMDFYPMSIDNLTVNSLGNYAFFVARLDSATGNALYLTNIQGTAPALGLSGDKFGGVYFCGSNQTTTTTIAGTPIGGTARDEPFIARMRINAITPNSLPSLYTSNDIKIYPNPTTDKLTIEGGGTIKDITIINMLGQQMLRQSLNSTTVISVDNFPVGVYIAIVSGNSGGQMISRTFIKQ